MQHLLDHLIVLLEAGGAWFGPIVGLTAFLEGIVAVGVLVPATPLLVVVGAAIGAGLVHADVLLWAMAGAALGSTVSFECGGIARRRGLELSRLPIGAAVAQTILHRYGVLSIVISRLVGPPAIVPFLAGSAGLNRTPFLLANGFSSVAWTLSMAGIGALASAIPVR